MHSRKECIRQQLTFNHCCAKLQRHVMQVCSMPGKLELQLSDAGLSRHTKVSSILSDRIVFRIPLDSNSAAKETQGLQHSVQNVTRLSIVTCMHLQLRLHTCICGLIGAL